MKFAKGFATAVLLLLGWYVGAEAGTTDCNGPPCLQGYQVPLFTVALIVCAFVLGTFNKEEKE